MGELSKFQLKQNLTQEELAEKADVWISTSQRLENGVQPKDIL